MEVVLDQVFGDFDYDERLARMEGPRVSDHFVVKMRGCDKTEAVTGDRFDQARAMGSSDEIRKWTGEHFPTMSKNYNIHTYGEDNCAQLCREWVRRMDHFYNVWLEHGTFETDEAKAACKAYADYEAFAAWLEALPAKHKARPRAMELRALYPNGV